jgi:hypothetical protein
MAFPDMNSFRIPVEHHTALAAYFDQVLRCRFVLDGEECAASEVFHLAGFLPMVAEIASRASAQTFGHAIGAEIVSDDAGVLGKRVILRSDADHALLLVKLIWGAEVLFQPEPGKSIELLPIYEFCWLPEKDRKPLPWLRPYLRQ